MGQNTGDGYRSEQGFTPVLSRPYPWKKRPHGRAVSTPEFGSRGRGPRVLGSNPARGEILPKPKRRFIAQSLSCSPFHPLEILKYCWRGCKTLTHPSILSLNPFWTNNKQRIHNPIENNLMNKTLHLLYVYIVTMAAISTTYQILGGVYWYILWHYQST